VTKSTGLLSKCCGAPKGGFFNDRCSKCEDKFTPASAIKKQSAMNIALTILMVGIILQIFVQVVHIFNIGGIK